MPRSLGWLFGTAEGQRLLETAYGQDGVVVQCMCTPERLRLHPYRTGSGTIALRCDDFSGPHHALECFRRGEITPYRKRAVRFQRAVKFDDDTNLYSISLRHSLELRLSLDTKPKRPKAPVTRDPDPSEVRGSIGLSTYSKFLIQTSDQHGNLAANFQSCPDDFCRQLAAARSRNVINGLPGPAVVLLAGVDDAQEHPRLQVGVRNRKFAIAFGVVAGGSKLCQPMESFGAGMIALPLEGLRQPLLIKSSEWEAIVDRSGFPHCRFTARRLFRRSDELYGLFAGRVFRDDTGMLRVLNGALRFAAANFIPVDSRLEAEVAMNLTYARRVFAKPQIYRTTDFCLPDFVLYDTNPITIIEVRGMRTPDYMDKLQRKLSMLRAMTSAHIVVVDDVRGGQLMCDGNVVELPPPSWAAVEFHHERIHGLDWGLQTVLKDASAC